MQISQGVPELCAVIRDRMARSPHQRISFADFMELALYHPQYGYYAAQTSQLGMAGDFVTSAHLGTDFAELLAKQFVEMWQQLNQPTPFHLVEMGPGQGLLADGLLAYLQRQHPDLLPNLHYILVETSPALQTAQQQRLERWQNHIARLAWQTLDNISPDSLTGCCFSNELVDAFPVHRVVFTPSGLQEQYVTLSASPAQPFAWVKAELSNPDLAAYFEWVGIQFACPPYPTGYTTEVNLAAIAWLTQISEKIQRGYLLTIDYGYQADRYYSPARSQGTLQCYTQHAHHNDPLINVGQQDITAHVDFTALERHGEHLGLETLGYTQQGLFLMALGLGDRLNALAQIESTDSDTIRSALQRRETLHQLISPLGLGNFNVLMQGKGLEGDRQRQLKGLSVPPLF